MKYYTLSKLNRQIKTSSQLKIVFRRYTMQMHDVTISLVRRRSSRTLRYGYLVTTSPPSFVPPSAAASQKGYLTDFGCYRLSWCDGRCVQGPGTYSPPHSDPRLLAIPASCRRIAAYNPN